MQKEHRFYEVDLLRFIAAFGVLLFHYTFRGSAPDGRSIVTFPEIGPLFKYGYLGVELFFIVSGFVVLLTALKRTPREFVVSRATRLYPAYWSCVTLTFLAIVAFRDDRFVATLPQYLVNLTMLQDFVKVPAIDGVYWTLTIELKFYLLIFALLLTGQIRHLQHYLAGWLVASICLDYSNGFNVLRFFLFPGYSYFFIAGATFLLLWMHGMSPYRLLLLAICFVRAVQFAIADSKIYAEFLRADFDPAIIGLVVSTFFVAFAVVATGRAASLGRPAFVAIGALTYPLYLLHQNIGFMLFNFFALYVPRYVLLVAVTLLMIGLAYSVHHWIEERYAWHLKRLIMRVLLLPAPPNRRKRP